ncbi:hypothetical protein XA68_11729 [Ophiocordyceps unilateralis]|uniref:Uncharacterized protein n=1 Tax=Ophiocordyceps unilateralis TaxID=268505 RepID=A0A2A9PG81_OPHUN|nr:hypothetical protein XA68_11729 [Ophiocordyceps unilateralis]
MSTVRIDYLLDGGSQGTHAGAAQAHGCGRHVTLSLNPRTHRAPSSTLLEDSDAAEEHGRCGHTDLSFSCNAAPPQTVGLEGKPCA